VAGTVEGHPHQAGATVTARDGIKRRARELLGPVAQFVADLGIPPSAITFTGLILSVLAAWALATGHFPRGGVLLVLAGICDMIDGASARAGNRTSSRGAFLDSTIDRYSEIVVLLGALLYFLVRSPRSPEILTAAVIFLALGGSLMVSYTRARAEAVGTACEVGWAERPERVVIMIVGALLGRNVFRIALWALAILSHVTALQRLRHVMARVKI
jgi:CDP-diacylglycerol--glycerol-3-phosphate 3-phosphatidyltransferase